MRTILIFVTSFLVADSLHAQKSFNLAAFKSETRVFEGIMDNLLKQTFKDPFALTVEPKGTYLQGYGMVFFVHLNINRSKIRTPFGEMDAPRSMAEKSKEEQIRLIKELTIQCLADYGATMKQLAGQDRITISAHVEDRNELDPSKDTTVLVFSATKDDIELFTLKKITIEKFRERVHLFQY
ncbi:MAG: hypothetical protein HY645_11395 [Acidobacteria bacterium]|nr:hypothetical protein [Acidobacteriota bacterium]